MRLSFRLYIVYCFLLLNYLNLDLEVLLSILFLFLIYSLYSLISNIILEQYKDINLTYLSIYYDLYCLICFFSQLLCSIFLFYKTWISSFIAILSRLCLQKLEMYAFSYVKKSSKITLYNVLNHQLYALLINYLLPRWIFVTFFLTTK